MQKLIYVRGPATLASIRLEVDLIWRQLAHDEEFNGLRRSYPQLRNLDLNSPAPFVLVTNRAGLTSELGDIAVELIKGVVLSMSKDALIALWNNVILKKLHERLGDNVLRGKNGFDGGSEP